MRSNAWQMGTFQPDCITEEQRQGKIFYALQIQFLHNQKQIIHEWVGNGKQWNKLLCFKSPLRVKHFKDFLLCMLMYCTMRFSLVGLCCWNILPWSSDAALYFKAWWSFQRKPLSHGSSRNPGDWEKTLADCMTCKDEEEQAVNH